MRWFENPHFDFVDNRKYAYIFSGTLVAIAILSIIFIGPGYGIDFKGGKQFVLQFKKPVEVTHVRQQLTKPLKGQPEVKKFGDAQHIMVRTDSPGTISSVQDIITTALQKADPSNSVSVQKTDVVGPRFAQDLKKAALDAVIFAIIIIFIYILIRFKNWSFSFGAVVALCHDVLIVLGVFTVFNNIAPFSLKIDESIIAAFLTIVGYSLNDTVVVYDRVRENMRQYKTMDFKEMMNKSLNDTLSRTVITALTTLFTVTVLFFFGGQVLKGFSFAMMLGIIVGTYSSLFVASALVVELHYRDKKRAVKSST